MQSRNELSRAADHQLRRSATSSRLTAYPDNGTAGVHRYAPSYHHNGQHQSPMSTGNGGLGGGTSSTATSSSSGYWHSQPTVYTDPAILNEFRPGEQMGGGVSTSYTRICPTTTSQRQPYQQNGSIPGSNNSSSSQYPGTPPPGGAATINSQPTSLHPTAPQLPLYDGTGSRQGERDYAVRQYLQNVDDRTSLYTNNGGYRS